MGYACLREENGCHALMTNILRICTEVTVNQSLTLHLACGVVAINLGKRGVVPITDGGGMCPPGPILSSPGARIDSGKSMGIVDISLPASTAPSTLAVEFRLSRGVPLKQEPLEMQNELGGRTKSLDQSRSV